MGHPRARTVRNSRSLTIGQLLYAVTFCLLLPALLGVWASGAAKNISLPVPVSAAVGALLTATGAALSFWGMASIVRWGEGLPMNVYPPACYVRRGAYGFLRHPIYVGFALACFGVAALTRSSAGFWLVAPAAALGCTALVLGYERLDLRRRFGAALHRPWLSLPPDRDTAAWVPFYVEPVKLNLVREHGELIKAIKTTLGDTMPVVVKVDAVNISV